MAADRVLVTGGAGFIGSHIVEALQAAGYEPVVLDNLSSGAEENLFPGVSFYRADITDAAQVMAVVTRVRPRFVVHQAAQVSVSRSVRDPAEDARANVLGLIHVLDAAVQVGVERVVFASSGGVLYGDVTEPAAEDHPCRPVSPYGLSKWAGEQYLQFYARQHGLQAVALRYANVYGPRQSPHGEAGVVAIFLSRLLAGQPPVINGDGRYVRDYVYVADVARANLLALTAPLPSDFVALNIGTGVGTDVVELEQRLRAALERVLAQSGRTVALPPAQFGPPRPGDLRSSRVDWRRAQAVLGWSPAVPLDEGLERTALWFAGVAHRAGR